MPYQQPVSYLGAWRSGPRYRVFGLVLVPKSKVEGLDLKPCDEVLWPGLVRSIGGTSVVAFDNADAPAKTLFGKVST